MEGNLQHGEPEDPHLVLAWSWGASVKGSPNPILSVGSLHCGDLGQSHPPPGPQFPLFYGSSESDTGSALRRQVQDLPAPLHTLLQLWGEA